jgi:hypothetical protein
MSSTIATVDPVSSGHTTRSGSRPECSVLTWISHRSRSNASSLRERHRYPWRATEAAAQLTPIPDWIIFWVGAVPFTAPNRSGQDAPASSRSRT